MPNKKAIEMYREGKTIFEGVEYTFIKEQEGKLFGDGHTDAYTNGYSRESIWYIKDEKGNNYEAVCFEAGDYLHDMGITNSEFCLDLI